MQYVASLNRRRPTIAILPSGGSLLLLIEQSAVKEPKLQRYVILGALLLIYFRLACKQGTAHSPCMQLHSRLRSAQCHSQQPLRQAR